MMTFPWVVEPGALPGFVIRATVVLATGLVLAWLVRRKSAQIRHRLWTMTLFVLLLLPPLTLWAPQWRVPLLPAAKDAGAETGIGQVPAPPTAATRVVPVSPAITASGVVRPQASAADGPTESVSSAGLASSLEPPDERAAAGSARRPATGRPGGPGLEPASRLGTGSPGGPGLEPASGLGADPAGATGIASVRNEPARGDGAEPVGLQGGNPVSPPGSFPNPTLLWAVGCLVGLASLAAGHLRFHRLVRSAHPLRGRFWQQELETASDRLGLRRDVRLLVSEAAGTPMTGGFRKPVILLPASASTWDSERRQVVLTHELVHVHHRDAFRQLMGGLVLALYWFHPLSWLACRLAGVSREEACDERVLELGSRPSEYARHLMSLATGTSSDRLPVAALSMARLSPSRLEKRIMAILRPRRPRPSALATAALVAAIAALGGSVAVTHPVQREDAEAIVVLADPPVVAEGPALLHEVDQEALGAAVPRAESPSETLGSGSPMSNPRDAVGELAGDSGEESVEAGAAEPAGAPASEDRAPQGTEPGDGAESFAGAPATVSRDAPSRDAPSRPDVLDVDCDTLPQGVGNMPGGGATASGPDAPARDVVRVVMETVEGVRLCMRIRTDAVVEEGELRSLAPDDWILLESEEDRVHRLIIRNVNGGFEYWWSVGGENRPFDDQAKEWRDGMLAVLGGQLEIGRIQREVSDLQDQISHHRGVVSGLQGQVAHERDVVASLQGQVAYYQGVVADLLDQISYHQGVVAGMRDDITYHRGVVSGLRDEITYHRARVAALQEVKSTYEAQITAIIPQLKTADATTRQSIEASIRGWEERIREIEEQIEAYGLGGKVAKILDEIRKYSLDDRVRGLEQRIRSYELQAGLQKIDAEIEEQSKRLDDVTRRAEEALRAREARIGEVEREVDAYYLDDKVGRLERQIRDLGAGDAIASIEQSIEEARQKLLELIRQL